MGRHGESTCPHDCPSACALEVELLGGGGIGRIRGSKAQTYTAGVICAKVARYADRLHHPDRLTHPLKRTGAKGAGDFQRISWDEALDIIAAQFDAATLRHGAESVWPYYYSGTMGQLMRNSLDRLTHVKKYSRYFSSICVNPAWSGFLAGAGRMTGADPREIAKSDCVVIWGTNAVATQVNVMTHAARARKERGAKIVAVDIYRTPTMAQADLALCLRPGTDGALACAVMHVLFREGWADRAFLDRYTDAPQELEAHLQTRTPAWASAITGLEIREIEDFAQLLGARKRSYFRLGYGFSRSRNGAANMHAVSCLPAVMGAWALEGGGACQSNGGVYRIDKKLIRGLDCIDLSVRQLDQSRIGAILTGEKQALKGGPPVTAMLIQNTNPVCVAPHQNKVVEGFSRENLFVAAHEHFLTDTAKYADIVLPATMFLEHDDFYTGGGHSYIGDGPKLVEPPGECRSNHDLVCALAKRLGAVHRGFEMSARELLDETLRASGWGGLDVLRAAHWIDAQPPFERAHFCEGFGWPDGKFRFKPDWSEATMGEGGPLGAWADMPKMPDHWDVIEAADAQHPFRLATSPARHFLNSSFSETQQSQEREQRPSVLIHPDDAAELSIVEGDLVELGNRRGRVHLHARLFAGVQRGVLVSEGLWPNSAFIDGQGINALTSDDQLAPYGGAAFHDNSVWLRRA